MYTIDLLKGSGLPAKSSINNAIVVGLLFSVPVMVLIMMSVAHTQSKIRIQNHAQTLDCYKHIFVDLKYYLAKEELVHARCRSVNSCLNEVNDLLDQNMQWSDILTLIEDLLPESLAIDHMEVKIQNSKKTVPQRSDPEKMIIVPVYNRTLSIELHTQSQDDSDDIVKKFQEDLANESVTKTLIDKVIIFSHQPVVIDGKEVVSYIMNCTFKDR